MIGRVGWVMLAVAGTAGCDGEDGGQTGDTGSLCANAPVTTWDNFGAGFVTERCQPCHASTSTSREGAPAEVTFDDEASVWTLADRVLDRATGPDPTMPPEGGVEDDDRYLLEVWLTCDAPGG